MAILHLFIIVIVFHQFTAILAFRLPIQVGGKRDPEKNTLRQINVVIRHGHRSPQSTFPNDQYRNKLMKPFGWGQLTTAGRQSQYNQGLFLRERYGQFLGTEYSPDIFWLQSTASDRTKMSALLESAALWQPNEEQTFRQNLAWQPVALDYQTSSTDNLLLIWSTCPDYARARDAVLKSPQIKAVNEANKDLYKALSAHTGMTVANPDDVFDIFGTLQAEENMNLELPDWTKKYYPEKMYSLSSLSLKMNVYDEPMLKMKTAPLITKLTNNMVAEVKGTLKPEHRKMFMYVGHDSTVVNLLVGLKVWNEKVPFYSIMTMVELHEDENGYNVQLYLRNTTDHEPYPLTIPGCEFACPLKQFKELVSPMILTDEQWKQECILKDPNFVPGEEPLP